MAEFIYEYRLIKSSNAFERSMKMPRVNKLVSRAADMLSVSSVTAREVSRLFRNPYWLWYNRSCLAKKLLSLLQPNFSKILAWAGSMEIGL